MDCLIGIQGKDFVFLATDTISSHSIVKIKSEHDKMFKIGERMVMAVSGNSGDTVQFAEFVSKNIQLYKMKNGYEMSLHASANYARKVVAGVLRTERPMHVNVLVAGVDNDGPGLYFIDFWGAMMKVPFAIHGYGPMFTLSIMDRFYKPEMRQDEVVHLLKMCLNEIQTRFVVDTSRFMIRCVSKEAGVQDLGFVAPQASII